MDVNFANSLMTRPLQHRFVKAVTPKGIMVDGLLLTISGDVGTIKRADGKKNFNSFVSEIFYR